jgi:hypothetical protein
VSPIFILKLARRDNDENNNCHRQEDINPHHAHIVLIEVSLGHRQLVQTSIVL